MRSVQRRFEARPFALLLLFLYLSFVRTRGISQTFWLLGDQILYWRIALGPWQELPIGGGPSSVGGTTLGPVFVWTMWVIRHVVGPWTQNLPHAGGIGLAIIQSAADAFVFAAIWRRFDSFPLALAVTLVVATAPYDMALTATIWNPPLAVAFVKFTLALVFFGGGRSMRWSIGATATALLAVQAHSSAVFFAVPVIASFTLRELRDRRWTRALHMAGASAAVVLVMEVPFLLSLMLEPDKGTSPSIVVNSVGYTLTHPGTLRPAAAFRALVDGCEFILLKPWTFGWLGTLLAVSAAATAYRMRDDLAVACSTVAPLVCAIVGFSFWRLRFDHYWFLTIAPSAALTIGLALTAWPPVARPVALALAVIAAVSQPPRLADAMTIHRLPEYEPLARGSREIRRHVAEIRAIDTEFSLPLSTDRTFLFQALGGRIDPANGFAATIDPSGFATFKPVP